MDCLRTNLRLFVTIILGLSQQIQTKKNYRMDKLSDVTRHLSHTLLRLKFIYSCQHILIYS